jgi:hypothetical protein
MPELLARDSRKDTDRTGKPLSKIMIDFDSAQTAEQSEPINLRWNQELAASWSVFRPSWVASGVLAGLMGAASDRIAITPNIAYLAGKVILLAAQSVFASRLVRKNYRSFFIGVLKEGEPLSRDFSLSEQVNVSMQLLLPYAGFHLAALMLPYFFILSWQTTNNLNSLAELFVILVLGPAAIRWAMHAKYRGFRLQAYRHERKWDPAWSSIRSFRRNAEQRNDQTDDDASSRVE